MQQCQWPVDPRCEKLTEDFFCAEHCEQMRLRGRGWPTPKARPLCRMGCGRKVSEEGNRCASCANTEAAKYRKFVGRRKRT